MEFQYDRLWAGLTNVVRKIKLPHVESKQPAKSANAKRVSTMRSQLVPAYDKHNVVTDLKDSWRNFLKVVDSLEEQSFDLPTSCPNWSVRDIVAHVVGVEKTLLGEPTPEVVIAEQSHIKNPIGAMNERWVVELHSLDTVDLTTVLHETLLQRQLAVETLDESDFQKLGWSPIGDVPYARFMSIRVFDIWVHEQDIREATGNLGGTDTAAARRAYLEAVANMGYVVGKKAALQSDAVVGFHIVGAAPFSVAFKDGRGVVVAPQKNESCSIGMEMSVYMRLIAGRVDPSASPIRKHVELKGDIDQAEQVIRNLAFTV